jgi:hypothetical protein
VSPWQPEAEWLTIPGGTGASTAGVWRTAVHGRAIVVKRLNAPAPGDPSSLRDPLSFAYWRRSADVVTYDILADTPGMTAPATAVEEDGDGITLTSDFVEDAANPGLFIARSLGAFAGARLMHLRWMAHGQFADRLARVARRGGWPTLARTTAADLVDAMWRRRAHFATLLDELPQVAQHGDPTPTNLRGRDGDRLLAIDWGSLGVGPVGGDLGLYLLHAREELEPLIEAYLLGMPESIASPDQVLLGARITSVFTALTRAEWALARVAGGEGALAAKFRHPSVAPHLRVLQRQADSIESLLGL